MSNTNKNGPSKFKIANATRISIIFVTHTIISKILVNVLFTTFRALWLSTNSPSTALGYASSIQMISFMMPTAIWQWWFFSLCNCGFFYQVGHTLVRKMWRFRVAWQGSKADKSMYLFSLFCFSVKLLNQRALTSLARPPPYIIQTNLPSFLQRSSLTASFSPNLIITSLNRDLLLIVFQLIVFSLRKNEEA